MHFIQIGIENTFNPIPKKKEMLYHSSLALKFILRIISYNTHRTYYYATVYTFADVTYSRCVSICSVNIRRVFNISNKTKKKT